MTQDQIQKSMDYKNTFSGEHGQRVLEDLDRKCLYKRDIFNESQRITDFNLGMNAVIRYIHNEIDRKLTEETDNKAEHKEIK